MITSTLSWLVPDLMDIVRLFPEADSLDIAHDYETCGLAYVNKFRIGAREYKFTAFQEGFAEPKSLVKRYAKLALYDLLSELYNKKLPWGSLTGVRPTRLAYMQLNWGCDWVPLFKQLRVSEENIELVRRVIEGQKGIYERKNANADLYVSLPFCPTKCVYCSFVTAPVDKTRQFIPAYLDALEREIAACIPLIQNLRSVYVGGGTPFALDTADLERVLKALSPFVNGREFTVEAGRPDVFTREKLQLCKDYGVTRICINAQSFSDKTLERIGRKHTAKQVEEAFEMAKPFGFITNCDLIAGLTDESVEEFCNSIDKAIALAPENITVHTLCLKKGAKLKEETSVLDGENIAQMIAYSREKLTGAGYEPYYLYRQKYMAGAHENVGWTKKGFASVYNIDVMEECANNIAVGANAVSKRVNVWKEKIERLASPKDIPTYLEKAEKMIADRAKLFGGD